MKRVTEENKDHRSVQAEEEEQVKTWRESKHIFSVKAEDHEG